VCYKLLGKRGLRVPQLCLGTMTFGEKWGCWGASTEEGRPGLSSRGGAVHAKESSHSP
jgi:aryl-alcohol dehydrogenase-like predicted oxidoreductase